MREMPSRCALPRMAIGVRPILRLMTPVGVLPLASSLNVRTSWVVHSFFMLRLYLGCALRGPVRPIGEPGRFQAATLRRAVFAMPYPPDMDEKAGIPLDVPH